MGDSSAPLLAQRCDLALQKLIDYLLKDDWAPGTELDYSELEQVAGVPVLSPSIGASELAKAIQYAETQGRTWTKTHKRSIRWNNFDQEIRRQNQQDHRTRLNLQRQSLRAMAIATTNNIPEVQKTQMQYLATIKAIAAQKLEKPKSICPSNHDADKARRDYDLLLKSIGNTRPKLE